jgi:hypothetical protein
VFPVDFLEQKENISVLTLLPRFSSMPSRPQANVPDDDELEAEVDEAIAVCDGDLRATIRALIVANQFLECEVGELMKAVSHAYVRGRFNSYSG